MPAFLLHHRRYPAQDSENHWLFKFLKVPVGMPKSRIKHTATGTRSRETESDSEIPSVSTSISSDHLFLLKMLHDCYLRSFKVRGFISSSTVSMLAKHLPCLLLSALPGSPKPQTAQACIELWQLDRVQEFVVVEFAFPIHKKACQVAHKIGNLVLKISKGGLPTQCKRRVWSRKDCVAEA